MPATFNTLANDDTSNTLGTFMDVAQLQALLMGVAPAPRTDTGAVNNWAPGIDGHTFTRWAGAADAIFSGLAGGRAGLLHVVRNTGTKVGYFLHQSGLSSAGNKFTNAATSGPTPVAPGGMIAHRHDGTDWQLVAHEQGGWVTPTYSGLDYTASPSGGWAVGSGDVIKCAFLLDGRRLRFSLWVLTTDVTGTPASLRRVVPGGFAAVGTTPATPCQVSDTGGAAVGLAQASGTAIDFYSTIGGGGWTGGASRSVACDKDFEVA